MKITVEELKQAISKQMEAETIEQLVLQANTKCFKACVQVDDQLSAADRQCLRNCAIKYQQFFEVIVGAMTSMSNNE